ncbi:histone deacetylase family protein [Pandoraea sp. PE-S2T-3]|uniref:histone deacetylase family protein n=1 Tax=Pandoraea sp. PE-S2T-3 TaxID=1986993 RepID=UPI000B3F97FD|nr:histone deacetylase family protein [Pandoraea sp. PE-S2T-3]
MLTLYSDAHLTHQGTEWVNGEQHPSVESPARAANVLASIRAAKLGECQLAERHDSRAYMTVHSERYVRFLENAWRIWQEDGRTHHALPLVWPARGATSDVEPAHIEGKLGFYAADAFAAITPGTWEAARTSADVALSAMRVVAQGASSAFALCRPPGHHASRESMGGYCYLNNAALAAQGFIDSGASHVAILDIDYHHGNGTQSIFEARDDVLFVSIHGDTDKSYPYFYGHAHERGIGDGLGYTLNLPLPHGTGWADYRAALTHACDRIAAYAPDAVVISLGVDTFKNDPISRFTMESEDYLSIGHAISKIARSTLFVLEGGYCVEDIGVNVSNTLIGFSNG